MKIFTNLLCAAILLFLSASAFAQSSVGKLSGKVVDADTKEPLIGANIVILNSDWGAATDVNGEYFILNIPPGNYDVRFSYVGYANKTIQEVRIVSGVTYELNVDLSTDFTLPDIIVQDRKFFEEKATNTKKVIDSDQIERLPVRGVENLASLQAGVVIQEGEGGVDNNATINVRGGRGNEVLYIVDGIPQNDLYTGSNYSQVSNSAIEQIAFEIGGYEAKYGQAQSGIINVTTKTGDPTYSLFADAMSSSFTDDYGYNVYSATLGGPIIPGVSNHTFFLSGERGWFLDADPKAIDLEFPTLNATYDYLPNNSAGIYRFTARTNHSFGDWTVRLGGNVNLNDFRTYTHTYAKNNSEHNPRIERMNSSYSARISQNVSTNSFWNLTLGFKEYKDEQGDGVYFDNLEAYGNRETILATEGVDIGSDGIRIGNDRLGVFFGKGRIFNDYRKTNNRTFSGDLDFTMQVENHLVEIGGGGAYNILRYYRMLPLSLATRTGSLQARYYGMQPTVFGYDITGSSETSDDIFENHVVDGVSQNIQTNFAPKNPVTIYTYLQDRFELDDMVLNVGIRFDYFDTQTDILKNPTLPYAEGDPNIFDAPDFKTKKPEFYVSPRIGIGFPVTESTVFHAQFGKFIQQPPLNLLYANVYDYSVIITDDRRTLINGQLTSEVTTQYEVGFRQVLGNIAALNITAFYKNTEGLVNSTLVFFQRQPGGQRLEYYAPLNSDFGTIKGLALSANVSRVSYFSLTADYTYSLSEGTGSSTNSSYIAAFRNIGNIDRVPKVIAPLDFDQRHTGTINLDFFVPKGDLGFLELLSANVLVSFNSGRPYTPLSAQNLLTDNSNYGDALGYVNSAYGPGNFRIDMKLEKGFQFGSTIITPYLWVENLLDADNVVTVYQSTGSPLTTGYLLTEEGKNLVGGDPGIAVDYKSLERDPTNFGIPRLIRLGLKINFTNIQL